jgi:hypothetical protein
VNILTTIDWDYTGNLMIVLKNNSNNTFRVNRGDCIAQMIVYKIADPTIQEVEHIQSRSHGADGFGSTGMCEDRKTNTNFMSANLDMEAPHINIVHHNVADPCTAILNTNGIKPYNIWLSTDPFHNKLNIHPYTLTLAIS